MDSKNPIPAIDQVTIECNLNEFTRWLNDIKDALNALVIEYENLSKTVEDHEHRILCLEERVEDHEERLHSVETRLTEVERIIEQILNDQSIIQAINMINGRVDFLYDLLPIPYGMIVPRGWKFAMGNINVMDEKTGPSMEGHGLFTKGTIDDYDLYFKGSKNE